jgi:hypothetical protein
MDWMNWGWNSGGNEIFLTLQIRPGPHSASYSMGVTLLPEVKRPEPGINHLSSSSAEVKGRKELCFYSSYMPS